VAADLSDPAELEDLAGHAGTVDVLVNNAGFSWFGPTAELDVATFDRLFATNVRAPYLLVAAVLPKMAARGSGSIINIASMVGQIGLAGGVAYGATKATLASMTRSWAADLRDARRHPGGPALHLHADPEGS
jgi:short-subunit dehydrogenase